MGWEERSLLSALPSHSEHSRHLERNLFSGEKPFTQLGKDSGLPFLLGVKGSKTYRVKSEGTSVLKRRLLVGSTSLNPDRWGGSIRLSL